jgi:hypothetical protein
MWEQACSGRRSDDSDLTDNKNPAIPYPGMTGFVVSDCRSEKVNRKGDAFIYSERMTTHRFCQI